MQCPGQDSRYWDGEAIFESHCSKCGATVEFFKDESKRKCQNCGHEVLNPKIDFGCASYCPYAEQCLGSPSPEMLAQKQELLIDRVAIEMKKLFDGYFQKIGTATKVARYAGDLAKTEEANKAVILIASYLHSLGSDPAVKDLLSRLGANQGIIDEVCGILSLLPDRINHEATVNARVIHDAVLLETLTRKSKGEAENCFTEDSIKSFLTIGGAKTAKKLSTDMGTQ